VGRAGEGVERLGRNGRVRALTDKSGVHDAGAARRGRTIILGALGCKPRAPSEGLRPDGVRATALAKSGGPRSLEEVSGRRSAPLRRYHQAESELEEAPCRGGVV
jgi:hypothetical protein